MMLDPGKMETHNVLAIPRISTKLFELFRKDSLNSKYIASIIEFIRLNHQNNPFNSPNSFRLPLDK